MAVKIFVGDCRRVMANLPENSVHCVVTSTPYWGKRDYGVSPDVWGGDPNCQHEWGEEVQHYPARHADDGSAGNLLGGRKSQQAARLGVATETVCRHCGAWFGVLGQEALHDCGGWAVGWEPCTACFTCHLRVVFAWVWRVLRPDGSLWLNMGDSSVGSGKGVLADGSFAYGEKQKTHRGTRTGALRRTAPAGGRVKKKDMAGIPWLAALALQADGWILRRPIIWNKPDVMPQSVTDTVTLSHEDIFHMTKRGRYYHDYYALAEPAQYPRPDDADERIARAKAKGGQKYSGQTAGSVIQHGGDGSGLLYHVGATSSRADGLRNARSVWTFASGGYSGSHYATFPPELPRRCIVGGTSSRGCCPHCGKPWQREVIRIPGKAGKKGPKTDAANVAYGSDGPKKTGTVGTSGGGRVDGTMTAGEFKQACKCPAHEPIPCIVLDPFGGAGTTGLAADRNGRDAWLIELNEEYAIEAAERIRADAGLFADVEIVRGLG